MSRINVIVSNVSKGHANPIAELVQLACRYDSEIILESDNRRINAKSIMGVMILNFAAGTKATVTVDGPDEEAALAELGQFLEA